MPTNFEFVVKRGNEPVFQIFSLAAQGATQSKEQSEEGILQALLHEPVDVRLIGATSEEGTFAVTVSKYFSESQIPVLARQTIKDLSDRAPVERVVISERQNPKRILITNGKADVFYVPVTP